LATGEFEMKKKICQISLLLCSYASLDEISYECNYDGYCDYQLPRDSREEEITLRERITDCSEKEDITDVQIIIVVLTITILCLILSLFI
jgi:hypothetical protein